MDLVSSRILKVSTVALLLLLWLGCASGGASGPDTESKARQSVPASSPLARIQEGMTDIEVRTKLGAPSLERFHRTGKQWIPFYFGSDTARFEWWYEQQGIVVFNRNPWTGAMRVREVIYDPNALKDGGR